MKKLEYGVEHSITATEFAVFAEASRWVFACPQCSIQLGKAQRGYYHPTHTGFWRKVPIKCEHAGKTFVFTNSRPILGVEMRELTL